MADGSVTFTIDLTKEQFEKALKSVKSDLDSLKTPSQNITKSLADGFTKVGKTVTKAGSFMTKTFTVPAISGLTACTVKAKSFITTYESAITLFEKRLGSKTSANEMYESLLNIAKASTFAQENMIKAGQTLVAMGVDSKRTAKFVQVATDAISGMGGSGDEIEAMAEAFGKMSNQVVLHTDDLNQLATKGLPVWDILAKKYGKTKDKVQEMASKGLLPATETLDYMTEVLTGNVKGMEEFSIAGTAAAQKGGTLKGVLDGLNSSFRSFALNVLGMNINKGQTENYQKLIGVIGKIGNLIESVGSRFSFSGNWVGDVLNKIDKAIDKFQEKLDNLSDEQLKGIASAILKLAAAGPILLGLGKAFSIFGGLFQGISNVVSVGSKFSEWLFTSTKGIQILTKALALFVSPVGTVIMIITGIIAVLVILYNKSETFRNTVNTAINQIKGALQSTWQVVKPAFEALVQALGRLMEALKPLANFIAEKLAKHFQVFASILGVVINVLSILVSAVIEGLANIITKFVNFQTKVIQIITTVIDWFKKLKENPRQALTDLGNSIANTFKDFPQKALQWGKDMIQGFIDGIKSKIGSVRDTIVNLANTITSYLHFSRPDEGPLRDYETWMPDMIDGLVKTMELASPKLYRATDELAQKMADKFELESLYSKMQEAVNIEASRLSANILATANMNRTINVKTSVTGDAYMDSTKVGRIIAPEVSKTMKLGGVH